MLVEPGKHTPHKVTAICLAVLCEEVAFAVIAQERDFFLQRRRPTNSSPPLLHADRIIRNTVDQE